MDRVQRLTAALQVDEDVGRRLNRLWELVLQANRSINLTALTQEEDVFVKHFVDSAAGAALLPASGRVADVGSGGGFPGLVLALMRPDLQMTLVEATGKKAAFLAAAAAQLGLSGVQVVHARVEEYAHGAARETFAAVTARAVAPLRVLVEYAAPLLRVGGRLLAYKGPGAGEELAQAAGAMRLLHVGVGEGVHYQAGGERSVLCLTKEGPTPAEYPRSYKKIKEKPL